MHRLTNVTKTLARNVICTVDKGLIGGMGQAVPGNMCLEAVIDYCVGNETPSDAPYCVHRVVRDLSISINDRTWPDKFARAKALRALSVAQLGSNWQSFSEKNFTVELIKQFRISVGLEVLDITLTLLNDVKLRKGEALPQEFLTELATCRAYIQHAEGNDEIIKVMERSQLITRQVFKRVWDSLRYFEIVRQWTAFAKFFFSDFPGYRFINGQIVLRDERPDTVQEVKNIIHSVPSDAFEGTQYVERVCGKMADAMVEALKAGNSPGCKYLYLLKEIKAA